MTRDEALKLLRGRENGIVEWNRRPGLGGEIPSRSNANSSDADLLSALELSARISTALENK